MHSITGRSLSEAAHGRGEGMDCYSVTVTATVQVRIDPRDLGEDEDEHSLIFRELEEQHPDLRSPTIQSYAKA